MITQYERPVCPKGGEMIWIRDDYAWYADGSYEVYDCSVCGRVYIPLPD